MRATPSYPTTLVVAFLLGGTLSPSSITAAAAPSGDDNPKGTATATATACMASSTSGAFYDLRPDIAVKPSADGSKPEFHGAPDEDYHARGYDYGRNFTLNICEPVVQSPENVVGVKEELWRNISAYYTSKGDVYSLGLESANLTARGKELVLQYTGGSPCGKKKGSRSASSSTSSSGIGGDSKNWSKHGSAVHEGAAWKDYESDEEGDHDDDAHTTSTDRTEDAAGSLRDDNEYDRRKSATIFFSCDSAAESATASFIAADPEECHYIFKVKSQHACAGAEPHKNGSVGPGPVFLIIFGITVLVYLLGGIFYNRAVSNARGWKQLPNYTLWASVWSFITDLFVIALSSCARFLPSRRGYHSLAGSPTGRTRSHRDREAENRLIDQLDEEWDD
ncbi:Cation-independent mannose-6-phosphate receptor CI-MPR [Diatrype stigma]|uniref:Cation-independent mannose-6-phosphate receptor CI-MPR n=1 Tax=Diatrype stigma TaxID=117547 RepID=A0AAN9UMT0_9PEZI